MIMGHMNFNMLDEQRSSVLNDWCDILCLKNLVKKPTCYTCNAKPTPLDIILTNQDNKCGKLCKFGTGLSDVHNFIAVQAKCTRPLHNPKYRNCRSFKNFDEQIFLSDLQDIHWDIERTTNVNTAYETFNNKYIEVANKHASVKQRKILPQQTPYKNKQLKSAVYRKRMLYNRFRKNKLKEKLGGIQNPKKYSNQLKTDP
jgi:hypothetical protein